MIDNLVILVWHQYHVFFTWWNNLRAIQIPLHSESLEECILFGFQIEGDIFSVLSYCILIAKLHIYCQRIHNYNAINLFQYLIELKKQAKNRKLYLCTQLLYRKVWKISVFIWTIVKCSLRYRKLQPWVCM